MTAVQLDRVERSCTQGRRRVQSMSERLTDVADSAWGELHFPIRGYGTHDELGVGVARACRHRTARAGAVTTARALHHNQSQLNPRNRNAPILTSC